MALNAPQLKFAEGIASGLNATEAYAAAYPACKRPTAGANGNRLLKNAEITAEVQRIRAAAALLPGSAFLTIQEKRNFLARVVRSKLSQLAPDSDLWQEVTTTDAGTKRKMPDKLKAIAMDNDLAGEGSEAKAALSAVELLAKLTGAKAS